MNFIVTDVEYDFNDSLSEIYSISKDEQDQIVADTLGLWSATDEDDLIGEITCASGWCIKSIDYDIQLKGVPVLKLSTLTCILIQINYYTKRSNNSSYELRHFKL